ncbi:hypothetical protein DPMN_066159 [Dreissena polymorpha]|uniref:Uncharacterized protein n=1 Tax=Dreissena polymorpha TaxID=45954 RepID=A0A9D3YSZ3_DREPO|nr:hypothetical protein DPMN_066159 [Dreissena polymorpha]
MRQVKLLTRLRMKNMLLRAGLAFYHLLTLNISPQFRCASVMPGSRLGATPAVPAQVQALTSLLLGADDHRPQFYYKSAASENLANYIKKSNFYRFNLLLKLNNMFRLSMKLMS